MARKNYYKRAAQDRRASKDGMYETTARFTERKVKEVDRPFHKPKGLRKEIKKEKIARKKK